MILVIALVACDTSSTDPSDSDVDTSPQIDPVASLALPAGREINGKHASTGELCAWCHTNSDRSQAMRDAAGRDLAPWNMWRGSMMAHAAKDPFFRATVAAEMARHPDQADDIARDCMVCHTPAAFAESALQDEPLIDLRTLSEDSDLGVLARDGVTCVGCHMQDPAATGPESTWNGALVYVPDRKVFGPHRSPVASPMSFFSDFEPVYDEGYTDSRMCGACHMLQTETLGPDGPTGHVHTEQAPFVEWRSSEFAGEGGATCQACHLPTTDQEGNDIETWITRSPGGAIFSGTGKRAPYGRHTAVGGNAFALELIRDNRPLLGSTALNAEIQGAIDATRANLLTAAALEVVGANVVDNRVQVDVIVHNKTGHKLPTAYPSRRVWLEAEVKDASGSTVAHLGATDAEGNLLGADGSALASEAMDAALEPHRDQVGSVDEPIVWQSWMQDAEGDPTTGLLAASGYAKDNRLLPRGWAPTTQDAPLVAPVGTASDSNFVGGQDTVSLLLPVTGEAPFSVQVTLRYQSFSPRFLQELYRTDVPEARGLQTLLEGRGVPAEELASASISVD